MRRIPELDGLRGLAILLVLVLHANAFSGDALAHVWAIGFLVKLGWCGVDLFFALSGFLITGILLDASGPARARRFYQRRVLRILPLYYLVLAVIFGWIALKGHAIPMRDQAWYWFHLSNWPTAYEPMKYGPLTHFWSLAIEEQFYLVWPLVVWKTPRRFLPWICFGVLLACPLLRNLPAAQALGAAFPETLYRLTPFRIDTLAAGSIGALLYRHRATWRAARYLRLCGMAAAIVVACVLLYAGSPDPYNEAMTRAGLSALAVGFASLVTWAAMHTGGTGWALRALRTRLLGRFGQFSYCIYVIHPIVFGPIFGKSAILLGEGPLAKFVAALLAIAFVYCAGWCSWHLFEKRILAFGSRPLARAAAN